MEACDGKCRAIVIVAHPDDETLWAGGWIKSHSNWDWYIFSLCRANDPDRAPKYYHVLRELGAKGSMADTDDGPEQAPLQLQDIQHTILNAIPMLSYDYCFTHGPEGEYTRHLRHEEVSQAVCGLWIDRALEASHFWMFAYQDQLRQILPRPREDATKIFSLPEDVWKEKYSIVTQTYGFSPESWEARTTPRQEAFWCFDQQRDLSLWLQKRGTRNEGTGPL